MNINRPVQPHPTCVDELSAVLDHCYIAAGIDRLNDHANKETTTP